ncbi:uncharacterized protein LOC132565109 [Ylistrum balloti]|uniref:uncharacterized protein LOC132565109 n=1 Tax=Ylistrum balloti TaxID=509963 RepID=UPI002905BB1B|nr:uncharacterized protein LOC132565109 [Ylistrum balloti]XP_060085702.1 uncharacterized protein LOC132565109 [Ylistrum balloti]
MKLQPLLFDTMYTPPGLSMPSWGRWSRPVSSVPISRQPYERLREYTVPQSSQEIPADFWEPVVPNSTSDSSRSRIDDQRTRSEQSVPIRIQHVRTGRSAMYGMYDDRVCDYNQTSDYDAYSWDQSERDSQISSLSDDRTNLNSNANGARFKTNEYSRGVRSSDEYSRGTRSGDEYSRGERSSDEYSRGARSNDEYARCTRSNGDRERNHRTRSNLYTRVSGPQSRTSDNNMTIDLDVRPERSREDLVCTGVERPGKSKKYDYEDIDAQIAASYGYDMGSKDEPDVGLKVDLPTDTPILSKLRTLKSSNMYVILDNDEEEEVKTYKKTNPSLNGNDNLPGILNSRGEFYDLCDRSSDESCDCQELVVNLPPPKVKPMTSTEKPVITPTEKPAAKTTTDYRNISDPPSYPAYNIIRKVISKFGGVVDYIRGDGNCFFRALSKVVYGDESCHGEVRQAMVDIMEKFPKDFEQFIDNPSIQDHFKEMRKDGVWATQAEIYGAASFLQRDIYVLSPDHTGDEYRWLLFSPRLKCSKADTYHTCHVTLCHTNGNHYDRIAPATGDCNCGVPLPMLNGSNLQVDLTAETDEVV